MTKIIRESSSEESDIFGDSNYMATSQYDVCDYLTVPYDV